MEKLGIFSKKLKQAIGSSPFASRESLVVNQQRSRPTSILSTHSTVPEAGARATRGGPVPEPTSSLGRGDHGEDGQQRTINVILFGEAGVGKSAVVNLIAQRVVAQVSADVRGCTLDSTPHDVPFDGMHFRIFDTVGLNQPDLVRTSHLEAIERAYKLILKLKAAGGIHLLLFCMRRGKITKTTRNNYRLFVEFLCQEKVPVGVVVTNCEHEEPMMEDWWTRNKTDIEGQYGIKNNGHACITAVTDDTPGENRKYRESQQKIRALLKTCSLKNGAFTLDAMAWLGMTGRGMRSFVQEGKTPKRRDVEKVLSGRLRLRPDSVKRIIDMMETNDTGTSHGEH